MGDDADAELLKIDKELAKEAKQDAPVRTKAKKAKKGFGKKVRYKGAKPTLPGELKRSVRAIRAGKRYKQDGKWKFFVSRIVIRMRYYGLFIDRGWTWKQPSRTAKTKKIQGTYFLTKVINKRLVRNP
jgi:hypothetical protein